MISHTELCRWLVMDWATGNDGWTQSNETPNRLLLVTPQGRSWLSGISAPSLPRENFILITFAIPQDRLTEETFEVDKLFGQPRSDLPIWCHYGGPINLERLEDHWRKLGTLDEAVRVKLTKLMLAPYRYPMPISMSKSQQLDWNSQWDEIKSRIVTYEPAGWDDLRMRLNQAWNMATRKMSDISAKLSAKAWINALQVSTGLRVLLEPGGEIDEQLMNEQIERVLKEAKDSQLNRLRPQIAAELDSSNLSSKFDAVLNAVNALSDNIGHAAPSLMSEHAESLKNSVKHFEDAYQKIMKA